MGVFNRHLGGVIGGRFQDRVFAGGVIWVTLHTLTFEVFDNEGRLIVSYFYLKSSVATIGLLTAAAVYAADPPTAAEQEAERLKQETALVTAQAGLATAKAALEKAKIEALGLPKFENKTTLETGGGTIEATMLTSRAVTEAAVRIGKVTWLPDTKACPAELTTRYLLMTQSEKYDVNVPVAIALQINGVAQILVAAIGNDASGALTALNDDGTSIRTLSPTAVIGFVNAAAALLASETKVTGLDLSSINDSALIMATAPRMCGAGVVPSASMGAIDLASSATVKKLSILLALRGRAAAALQAIPENASPSQKSKAVALSGAIAAYEGFVSKIFTTDTNGQSPLSQALLIERFPALSTNIVRITVNKAGGSFVNSKNLWTTLGVDPVKVTGGIVVTYTITDAATGQVTNGETFSCQTTLTSLRKIHDDTWRPANQKQSIAVCR